MFSCNGVIIPCGERESFHEEMTYIEPVFLIKKTGSILFKMQ